ncbi:MAG: hypothetical protein KDA83_04235 [Planctomycetales bacterium]|nr:hypothetical protein [Planctomycetales bacterium]
MPGRDRVHEQNNATAPSLAKTARRLSLWTRRDALTAFAAVASQTLWPYHLLAQQAEGDATLPRHRQLKVEVTGTLELDPTGQKATTSPFSVNASFDFVERSARDGRIYWTARTFEEATARIVVGQGSTTSALSHSDEVVIESTQQQDDRQIKLTMTRPAEPLTLDESELIKLQAISPAIETWFEDIENRSLTDVWTPDAWSIAAALAIEVVTDNQVQCRLKRRQRGRAEVEVRGTLIGTADNVGTEIALTGTCSVDEASGRLLAASWDIQERRALGPATPGFTARTRLELTDLGTGRWDDASEQTFQQARAAALDAAPSLLVFESKHQGFRLEHSPQWTVIADSTNVAILRLVDQGDLITQAHVTRLQPLAAGTRLTKETYRQDVSSAIGNSGGTIVDVSEFTTSRDYHGLRVTVSAEVSGVAVQWVYVHLSDKDGQRLGWVFTAEQDRLDRLGIEDQTLVDSVEILAAPATANEARAASRDNGASDR